MQIAIDITLALIQSLPAFGQLLASLTGSDEATVVDRLKRAKEAIKDPIDVGPADAAKRTELERILRGTA